jgi:transcriptional regulator with XRE-family HTH domain
MNELRDFVESQLKQRSISMRDFARLMGVSHGSISRLLDRSKPEIGVSLDLLLKLSKATETPLNQILRMAFPGLEIEAEELSASAELMAQRFNDLPAHVQKTILAIMDEWAVAEGD